MPSAGCGAEVETHPAATPAAPDSEHCVACASFTGDEAEDAAPSWSPDGRGIAFHSTRNGNWEIWTIDVETCETTRVTRGEQPDWSGDGARLVFTRFEPGSTATSLSTSAADGSNAQVLTEGPADSFPAWSPRDDLLAFDRNTVDEEKGLDLREIHVVRAEGTGLRQVTDGGWHVTPAFSPDGAWIAWAHDNGGIWRVRTDWNRD